MRAAIKAEPAVALTDREPSQRSVWGTMQAFAGCFSSFWSSEVEDEAGSGTGAGRVAAGSVPAMAISHISDAIRTKRIRNPGSEVLLP